MQHTINVTREFSLKTLAKTGDYGDYYHSKEIYNHIIVGTRYWRGNKIPTVCSNYISEISATANRAKMSIQVDSPGVYAVPHIQKNSNNAFRYVFFPEAGKFSLVRIYKFLRDNPKWSGKGCLTPEIQKILDKTQKTEKIKDSEAIDLSYIIAGELKRTLPYGIDSEEDLTATEGYKLMVSEAKKLSWIKKPKKKVVEAPAEKPNKFEGFYMVADRYIPFVHTSSSVSDSSGFWLKSDLTADTTTVVPAFKSSANKSNLNHMMRSYTGFLKGTIPGNRNSYIGYQQGMLHIMFYDTEKNSMVISPEASHDVHMALREGVENKTLKVSGNARKLIAADSSYEFMEKANKFMKLRGFGGFVFSDVVPVYFRDSAQRQNWKTNRNEYGKGGLAPCYNVTVNYNGREIIGPCAGHGGIGHLILDEREDGEIMMVQSAWCQRISKWTKSYAIDQKNRDWSIEDWLSGPNAERLNMKIKEAPIVYYGNKAKKGARKAAILAKMRAAQNKLK